MTVSELHNAFKVEMDKTESLSYPSFLPEEIDYWLNKAYLMLINQKLSGRNYAREDLNSSYKRFDDFKALITEYTINTHDYSSAYSNAVFAYVKDLNGLYISNDGGTDYLYYISSNSLITYGNADVVNVPNMLIPASEKNTYIITKNNNPWLEYPVVFMEHKLPALLSNLAGFEVFVILYDKKDATVNSWSLTNLTVQYIRKPAIINVTSSPSHVIELSEHCHTELVALAVNLVIENIESDRIQTNERNLAKLE